jgi:MarR family transcriptional regulator, organic hydroperoxide resistance regulator
MTPDERLKRYTLAGREQSGVCADLIFLAGPARAGPVADRSEDRVGSKPVQVRTAAVADCMLRAWHADVPNDELAHLVKDASRAFSRSLQLRLAEHGVAVGHWAFLRILWRSDGITQHALSVEAGVMEPTTLTALRAMESLGYLVREQLPDNHKNIYVKLTPAGRRLKRRLVPLAESVNDVACTGLSAAELAVMRSCLLRMIDNLATDGRARVGRNGQR